MAARSASARLRLLGLELELDAQRDEALLRAVVQVALDPAALLVGRRLDPRARLAHLVQQAARLRGQPLVVQRHQRVRGGGGDERVVVAQPGVVHDRRHAVAVVLDRGQPAARRDGRRHERAAVRVDPAVVEAVDDLDRRVVERVGERGLQLLRLGVARQPGGEALHRARHEQPPAHEADEEREGKHRQRQRDDPCACVDHALVEVEPSQQDRPPERREAEDGGEEDRLERPAHHGGRRAQPGAESQHHRDRDRDQEQIAQRVDDVADETRLRADHVERVRRAVLAAAHEQRRNGIRVDQQRGRQVEGEHEGAGGAGEHAVHPLGEPPGREGQDRVDDRGLREPAADPADAVDDLVRGVRERRHEPDDADADEQPPEAGERHAAARVEPDRDRRADHQRARQPLDPVRPRRDEHRRQADQHGARDGGGASRARHSGSPGGRSRCRASRSDVPAGGSAGSSSARTGGSRP